PGWDAGRLAANSDSPVWVKGTDSVSPAGVRTVATAAPSSTDSPASKRIPSVPPSTVTSGGLSRPAGNTSLSTAPQNSTKPSQVTPPGAHREGASEVQPPARPSARCQVAERGSPGPTWRAVDEPGFAFVATYPRRGGASSRSSVAADGAASAGANVPSLA